MNAKSWYVLGYNPDEISRNLNSWEKVLDQDSLKPALDELTQNGEHPNRIIDENLKYTHKDGMTVWMHCRGLIIRDKNENPIRVVEAHEDITDFKKMIRNFLWPKKKPKKAKHDTRRYLKI